MKRQRCLLRQKRRENTAPIKSDLNGNDANMLRGPAALARLC